MYKSLIDVSQLNVMQQQLSAQSNTTSQVVQKVAAAENGVLAVMPEVANSAVVVSPLISISSAVLLKCGSSDVFVPSASALPSKDEEKYNELGSVLDQEKKAKEEKEEKVEEEVEGVDEVKMMVEKDVVEKDEEVEETKQKKEQELEREVEQDVQKEVENEVHSEAESASLQSCSDDEMDCAPFVIHNNSQPKSSNFSSFSSIENVVMTSPSKPNNLNITNEQQCQVGYKRKRGEGEEDEVEEEEEDVVEVVEKSKTKSSSSMIAVFSPTGIETEVNANANGSGNVNSRDEAVSKEGSGASASTELLDDASRVRTQSLKEIMESIKLGGTVKAKALKTLASRFKRGEIFLVL